MKPYPSYRPSGVEWLGDVPEGWGVASSRRIFRQIREPAKAEDEQLSATQKSGVIPQRLYMEQEDQKVVLALSGLENFKHVEAGDFVISLRSFQGGIEFSSYTGCVSPAYTVLRQSKEISGDYYRHLLKSDAYISVLQSVTTGIRDGRNVSFEQFGVVGLPLPPLPEQQAIAGFLDVEVGKIDVLVAEQRRLIGLLAEKRQAVISHAVTRGLNPQAPLKHSGIDWLGGIPEGWEVVRLRRLVTMNPSKSETASRARDEEVTFLPMETIGEDGSLDLSRTRSIGEVETGYTYLRNGDVAFAKITPCFENGKGALMKGLVGGIAFGTTELTVLRPSDPRLSAEFLYSVVSSPDFLRLGEGHMYGAGGQKRVPDDFAREFPIALPPRAEQDAIVAHLKATHDRFDTLTTTAQSAIDLLQERRAALISAAVTGKIDVRPLTAEGPRVA